MPTRGRFVCHVHCLVHDGAVRSIPCRPTTKTSDKISIICLFQLILQANPLFCFELWYSSCFEVKCWFHTFPKWCSHTPMWILILLDHRDSHVNLFKPVCFLLKRIRSFSTSARSIISSSQRCSFHPSPNCLCFSRPPALFPQGLRCLNQASILWRWSLSILFRQCSYPVILRKILTELQVRHSSLVFLSGGTNSSFWRWSHIPFSSFQIPSHVGAILNLSPLAIQLFWSAEDISEGSSCHSRSVQPISRCYLIQAV